MKYSKKEKETFVEKMRSKTKQFAIDTILFCNTLPNSRATNTISFQLIKSSSSTAANYRAACRGRSKAEFHSKLSISVEEADESQFWLEMIDGIKLACDQNELNRLLHEAYEIIAILAKARKTNSSTKAKS